MIIVSHDRHLLRTVTDNLLLVAHGKVVEFDGSLEDYRTWLSQQAKESSLSVIEERLDDDGGHNKKQIRQNSAEKRKLLRPLQNKLKKLEKQMEDLSASKEKL